MDTCAECDFDWGLARAATIATLSRTGDDFRSTLADASRESLQNRPAPSVWSPVEYTAHTRDAVSWYAARIRRVLSENRPRLTGRDWDQLCADRRYNEGNLDATIEDLVKESDGLATLLGELSDAEWRRAGIGSDGGTRSIDELARRAAHEVRHHAFDVHRMTRD